MVIDTSAVLDTYERQRPELKPLTDAVRALLLAEREIKDAQYQPPRAAELLCDRREQTVAVMADQLRALEEVAPEQPPVDEPEPAVDPSLVDPHCYTVARQPSEIVALLREVEGDPAALTRAWRFAQPRLREMAAREARSHMLPHAASAFSALTTWQLRVRSKRTADPVVDATVRRRREIREAALQVADTVGLRRGVEQAVTRASVGSQPAGNTTVGKFWDMYPHLRK